MRFATAALVLATALILNSTALAADSPLVPKITNPGFEDGAAGWGWSTMNGCRTWYKHETKNPHSGKGCLVIVNEHGYAPNVYGRLIQGVPVLPETEYELSVWARGTDVNGENSATHFTDWSSYTLNLPTGTFDWTRASVKFRTHPGQYSLNIGLNSVNSCKELALDDISLIPIGSPLEGEGISGSLLVPAKLVGHDTPAYCRVYAISNLKTAATLDVSIKSGRTVLLAKRAPVKPGENQFEWQWTSGKCPFGKLDVSVRILDAKQAVIAQASPTVEKLDSPLFAELDRVEKRLRGEFADLYKQCEAKGIPLDYPRVTRTTMEQFIPLHREDVRKSHNWRVEFAIKDFDRMLDESTAEMREYLQNPALAPNPRRFLTSKVEIDGLSLVGDRIDSTGKRDRGPVFLYGYGHFSQLRRDMNRLPGYGINMVQSAEIGPAQILTGENEVSLGLAREVMRAFDEAARNNVKVDFLISPHYFPSWAIAKWPHLANGGGGFLGFVPDEKEAKQVVERFLRIIIPMLRDKPALNSICLSNEPILLDTARASNTKPMWVEFLERSHGDVKTLNERYGTSYASFGDVPIPANDAFDAPQFHDWCSFNNQRFTAWHKWMADVIHEMAPDIPVHAKVMSIWLNRGMVAWGCDPELFGEMGQMNGNDCYFMGGGGAGWSAPWHFQNISYDLQRSVALKPIFNSENHISADRAQYYVAPEHYRTALWQGAMHGQSITTIWAWERCYDPGYDLYGLVMDRPGCARAVGLTCLDLNRFADEIAAIQHGKSPVAILYSIASHARGAGYVNAVSQLYSALCFQGFKVDFITEKQLQEGKGSEYKMLVFPESGHVQQATFDAVASLPENVKLLFFGDCLSKDSYGKPISADKVESLRKRATLFPASPDGRKLFATMHDELEKTGGLPEVRVVDAFSGEPVWGLEWLPAKVGNRTVISMVNLSDKPATVKVLVNGKRVQAQDLLSIGGLSPVRVVKPIEPILAEIER